MFEFFTALNIALAFGEDIREIVMRYVAESGFDALTTKRSIEDAITRLCNVPVARLIACYTGEDYIVPPGTEELLGIQHYNRAMWHSNQPWNMHGETARFDDEYHATMMRAFLAARRELAKKITAWEETHRGTIGQWIKSTVDL